MKRTFTQRIAEFFHLGRLPDEVKDLMTSEGGIRYMAEGVAETAIFRNFQSPGNYCAYRKTLFIGSVALSKRRLVVRAGRYNTININVAFDDPKFKGIAFSASQKYLSLRFEAAGYIPNSSGQIEVRLHLPDVSSITDLLIRKGGTVASC
jgi:hypothetical protein